MERADHRPAPVCSHDFRSQCSDFSSMVCQEAQRAKSAARSCLHFLLLSSVSSTKLQRRRESGYPCHISDCNGIASSFSLFRRMLAVGLLYATFVTIRYAPFSHTLSRTFIMKTRWILLKACSAFIEITMWFLYLSPFRWFPIFIDLFMYVKPILPVQSLWKSAWRAFFKLYFYFIYVQVCLLTWDFVYHVLKSYWRPGVSDPLKPDLQAIVSCLIWVLGSKLTYSARAMNTLHNFLAPGVFFKN